MIQQEFSANLKYIDRVSFEHLDLNKNPLLIAFDFGYSIVFWNSSVIFFNYNSTSAKLLLT